MRLKKETVINESVNGYMTPTQPIKTILTEIYYTYYSHESIQVGKGIACPVLQISPLRLWPDTIYIER